MIDKVRNLLSGRIISITSASANNEASYKESRPGFDEFDHPTFMEDEEVRLLYKEKLKEGNQQFRRGQHPRAIE